MNGFLFPVDGDDLAALDERERNYERADVTEAIRPEPPGRVWTYVGHSAGRDRCHRGLAEGRLVVSREYLGDTRASFEALGANELRRFEGSTDRPPCPVWPLRRVDTPGAARTARVRASPP